MVPAERPEPATAGPAVITLPAEIDIANACRVNEDLRAAFVPGVRIVIADMSGTRFCDTSGIHALVQAHKQAIAGGAEFRVVASARVLQVLAVLGLDSWLAIYPSLEKAVAGASTPEEDASHE
jgi:anti-anti-sigma factor